jgi:hypothetical protein
MLSYSTRPLACPDIRAPPRPQNWARESSLRPYPNLGKEEPVTAEVEAGTLVCFDAFLVHRSSASSSPTRSHILYFTLSARDPSLFLHTHDAQGVPTFRMHPSMRNMFEVRYGKLVRRDQSTLSAHLVPPQGAWSPECTPDDDDDAFTRPDSDLVKALIPLSECVSSGHGGEGTSTRSAQPLKDDL